MDDAQFVTALRAELVARIGAERYEFWFASQTRLCVEAGRLTVRAASAFVRDWLRRNFADDVAACSQALAGQPMTVEFDVEPSADCGLRHAKGARDRGLKNESPNPKSEIRNPKSVSAVTQPAHTPASRYVAPTLAKFAVGPNNEYAFRSAELTAHGRQQASPIVFCGPTGSGKTHLLRGVQAEYRRRHPRALAVYLTAEQFTTGFVDALRGSGLPSFRQKCRGADLLLIDDLQFFIGKARTIEELHHTVDTLVSAGRQLVLASDRNLSALRALGPELASRLAGGLVCEIGPLEFVTRLTILRQLRDEMGLAANDEVLAQVAALITAGARELRGALHRLQAVSDATDQPLSRELAESALDDLVRQSTRSVRLADVEQAVCDVFGCEAATLRSQRKGREQSAPRMLAMWLARKYTRAPWSEIGQFFGRRSHSTVIAAHRRVEKLITSQAQIGVGDQPCRVEEAIRRLESALRTA
jgi:chromosomal replication initiator protein